MILRSPNFTKTEMLYLLTTGSLCFRKNCSAAGPTSHIQNVSFRTSRFSVIFIQIATMDISSMRKDFKICISFKKQKGMVRFPARIKTTAMS